MSAADRLDEIQARVDAATDGPWAASHRDGLDWLSQSPCVDNDGHEPGSSVGLADAVDPLWGSLWPSRNAAADAEFIAHARADVPRLVAALRAVLARHRLVVLVLEGCHKNNSMFRLSRCAECTHYPGYPCPTVRAVEAALGEVAS